MSGRFDLKWVAGCIWGFTRAMSVQDCGAPRHDSGTILGLRDPLRCQIIRVNLRPRCAQGVPVKTRFLLIGWFLATLAACSVARAEGARAPGVPDVPSAAVAATQVTSLPPLLRTSPVPSADLGGAILSPFSPMPGPPGRIEAAEEAETAEGVAPPDEASPTATVVAALGGLAIFGCLLRLAVNGV